MHLKIKLSLKQKLKQKIKIKKNPQTPNQKKPTKAKVCRCVMHRQKREFEGYPLKQAGSLCHDQVRKSKQLKPLPTAEAWQLSNPPIFQLASLRASMELFDEAGIENLRARGDKLTSTLEGLLKKTLGEKVEVITPSLPERGSMLCLRFKNNPKAWVHRLREKDVHVDFREPDIIRATAIPLYSSYEDIYRFVETLSEILAEV